MSDSTFGVAVFVGYCVLCMFVGWLGCSIAVSGVHECSVIIDHAGHKTEYVTECRL